MRNEESDFVPFRLLSLILLISALVLIETNSNTYLHSFTFCISLIFVAIILELEISRRSRGYLAIPIVLLIAISYLYIGITGFQSNSSLSNARLSSFRLKLSFVEANTTLKIYILTSISILIGYCLRNKIQTYKYRKTQLSVFLPAFRNEDMSMFQSNYVIYFVASSNLTYATLYGINNLIYRDEYIPIQSNITNNFFLSFVNVINLIGLFALGWLSTKARGVHKIAVWFTYALSLLIFFCDGSRTFALGVVLFFVGRVIEKRTILRVLLFLISIPISILFANLIIFFRSGPGHGLRGHLSQLSSFDFSNAANFFHSNLSAWSFAITGYTGVIANPIPLKSFFIEINPLPGGLTGWYEIADTMRFNYYTPYTSIGELYNYSPILLLIFFALLGFISSELVIFQSSRNATPSNILQLFNGGSLLLFFLLTTQYNLRSSMRVLYLALLVNVFFYFRAKTLLKKKGV